MKTIAITGASGFIGRAVVDRLINAGKYRVSILIRPGSNIFANYKNIKIIEGDINDKETLKLLIEQGSTVLNFAYIHNGGLDRNISATQVLLDTCKMMRIKRLIHCSTAMVSATGYEDICPASLPYDHLTEYVKSKILIERNILKFEDYFDIGIIRPTAVFGPGGKNLIKLLDELKNNFSLLNYIKSCICGNRRMNLVYIDNVVEAFIFLLNYTDKLNSEIFNISDSDSSFNNFRDVERILMNGIAHREYFMVPSAFPLKLLSFILTLLGKSNVNLDIDYMPSKLLKLGLCRPVKFEDGLLRYAQWYLANRRSTANSM